MLYKNTFILRFYANSTTLFALTFIGFLVILASLYIFFMRDVFFGKLTTKVRHKQYLEKIGTAQDDPGEIYGGVHYDYSFAARLSIAPKETKNRYSHFKNYLATYDGLNTRSNWHEECFYIHDRLILKLQVYGNTLSVFYALEQKDLENHIYPVLTLSMYGKHAITPLLLKVVDTFTLGEARNLIDLLSQKFNLQQDLNRQDIYGSRPDSIPYLTFDELLAEQLIRIAGSDEENSIRLITKQEKFDFIHQTEIVKKNTPSFSPNKQDTDQVAGVINIKYNYSFMARLIIAPSPSKERYNELKNIILSYANVKSSITWKEESFIFRGKTIVKFRINGNTMRLYLALDPTMVKEKKYNIKDLSTVKEHATTPSLIRVRGSRGLLYAKQLIEEVFNQLGTTAGFDLKMDENFIPNVEPLKALLERNLIKIVNSKIQVD